MTLVGRRQAVPSRESRSAGSRVRALSRYLPMMVGVIASAIAWARIPPVARDTFWAEDGRTFIQSAIQSGPIASLFHPYAGYLHVIPRLLAAFTVSFVPVPQWAQAMTALSCVVAGLIAGLVAWRPARISLALLTVLTPLVAREVLGNAANLHSLLMWMGFWILIYRPRGRGGAIALSVLMTLAAFTEIQMVFLVPVLLFRWRDRTRWMPRAALVAGVAAQILTTLIAPRGSSHLPEVDPASIAFGYLINAVMPSWMPAGQIGTVVVSNGPWPAVILLAVCVAAAVIAVAWGDSAQRRVAIAMLGLSVLIWVASVMVDPAPFYDYADMNASRLAHPWLSRYGVIPGMLLLAELVLCLSVLRSRLRSAARDRRRLLPVALLAILMVSLVALSMPGTTRRSAGPAWEPQVLAAAVSCAAHPVDTVSLRETLGWTVTVPCALVDHRSADEWRGGHAGSSFRAPPRDPRVGESWSSDVAGRGALREPSP
jgi:hypothetical protein